MTIKMSPVLQAADWAKKAGELDKPYGIADDLKKLARLFDQLPQDALELDGLADAKAADLAEQMLKGDYARVAKAIADLARSLAAQAKKCEAELKKNAQAPKPAVAAAGQIAAGVQLLANDIDAAQAKALAELKSARARLADDAKKEQAAADKAKKEAAKAPKGEEEDDADAIAEHKDEAKFRGKVKSQLVSWLKKVKTEGAPRAKFTVVVLGKTWGVYLNKTAGESEKKIAKRLAGLDSGFKHCKGEMYYDPKAKVWVFEGPNIPVGRANATSMSLALKPIIGYAPRLRLQKPGEVGEDSEGADADPDEAQAQAQPVAGPPAKDPKGVEPLKAFTARLEALKPRILSAANADKVKPLIAQAGELARKGQVDKAQSLLGQVEDLLTGTPPKAPPQPTVAPAGPPTDKLAKVRQEWAAARSEAVRGIEQLARAIEQEYRDEVDQRAQVAEATKRLRALAGQLKDDLEKQLDLVIKAADAAARSTQLRTAKTRLTEVLRVVATDPLMKELDGNELMPQLRVVKPMQDKLREIAAVLG